MKLAHLKPFLLLTLLLLLFAPPLSRAAEQWQIEAVDKVAGDGPMFSSLALDRYGNLHVAYSNRGGNELRYAFRGRDETRWDTAVVDSEGGSFDTLAVDSHGWSHIVYNSFRLPGLHYAVWDGKQWQKFLIDPCKSGHQTSIQLDSQDHARISYYREQFSNRDIARDLKFAYFDGKQWYIQTVDHREGTGKWNSIALDRGGHPYISYSITTPGNLGFAHLQEASWSLSLADPPNSDSKKRIDDASSLVLDALDQPHIAYIDASARTVNYGWLQGSSWTEETVDFLVSAGADSDQLSLKLDKSGHPHLVYYDSGLGVLKYGSRDDKGWHIEVVERSSAGDPSLVLDNDDQPYISYSALVSREVRVAHKVGTLTPTTADLSPLNGKYTAHKK